jgi:hypothetical protein
MIAVDHEQIVPVEPFDGASIEDFSHFAYGSSSKKAALGIMSTLFPETDGTTPSGWGQNFTIRQATGSPANLASFSKFRFPCEATSFLWVCYIGRRGCLTRFAGAVDRQLAP